MNSFVNAFRKTPSLSDFYDAITQPKSIARALQLTNSDRKNWALCLGTLSEDCLRHYGARSRLDSAAEFVSHVDHSHPLYIVMSIDPFDETLLGID